MSHRNVNINDLDDLDRRDPFSFEYEFSVRIPVLWISVPNCISVGRIFFFLLGLKGSWFLRLLFRLVTPYPHVGKVRTEWSPQSFRFFKQSKNSIIESPRIVKYNTRKNHLITLCTDGRVLFHKFVYFHFSVSNVFCGYYNFTWIMSWLFCFNMKRFVI